MVWAPRTHQRTYHKLALSLQGELSNARGGPFAVVNGALAEDALVVVLPDHARMERPLYVAHVATVAAGSDGRQLSASAPRLLVVLGRGAEAEVVEEHVSAGSGNHAVFAVAEVLLAPGAALKHGYVQREAAGSVHFKSTLVEQAESSSYSLVEARVGGALSRHDLGVAQGGPDTATSMRHFLLASSNQLQDLHSKLVLDHPRGEANQLHKCIVAAASGRGVFDGNVKVRGAKAGAGTVPHVQGACELQCCFNGQLECANKPSTIGCPQHPQHPVLGICSGLPGEPHGPED